MKALPIKLMAVSISIMCILTIGFVSALDPAEAAVSLLWSTQTVYQGDTISVKITFTSNCTEQLTIVGIGLQFDWDPDKFYGHNLAADPVTIPSFGTHIFDTITIQIPSNVSTGTHSYFVGVDGAQGYSLTEFSWDSPTSTIQINAATGKIYNVLALQFEIDLNDAGSANYQSAEAKSLLQQAQAEYDFSRSLVNASIVTDEKWSEALIHVQNATNHLNQAIEAEQKSVEQGEQQRLLVYVAIAAIAVIIAVSMIIVVVRKRRKQPEPIADQSVDQSLEPQDSTPE
jgi:hypothetical protein